MSGFCIFLGYSSQHTFISFFFWMSSMAMNMAYKFSDIFKVCNDDNEYDGIWEALWWLLSSRRSQSSMEGVWLSSQDTLRWTTCFYQKIWKNYLRKYMRTYCHGVILIWWHSSEKIWRYFQGVPLLVTIITATMDNFGSCESTLPNIGRYSCFIR